MREEVRRAVLTHPSIRKNPAAPIKGRRTATANSQKVRQELLERFVKGPVVVIEKLNRFVTPEKTRTSHVAAVFLMKDGKIAEWTEYFITVG